MKVLSVPVGLRVAAYSLLGCVPLVAIQTILVSRAPWWNLPYDSIGIWSMAIGLIVFPLAVWITNGRRFALKVTAVFAGVWVFVSVILAIRTGNFWLGLFTLIQILYFGGGLTWIRRESDRSYFDPRMEWYQGSPKPIPGLECELLQRSLRVCRIDRDGAFVFLSPRGREGDQGRTEPLEELRPRKPLTAVFSFRDRRVECTGKPVRVLDGGRGVGIRFQELGLAGRRSLGDFVELLRGEGYEL